MPKERIIFIVTEGKLIIFESRHHLILDFIINKIITPDHPCQSIHFLAKNQTNFLAILCDKTLHLKGLISC